jgi:hypothetical protein
MLLNCSQLRPLPCKALGWKTYAFVAPVSLSATSARVRLVTSYVDRGNAPFVEGVEPTEPGYLYGSAIDVELVRDSPSAPWRFSKIIKAAVG